MTDVIKPTLNRAKKVLKNVPKEKRRMYWEWLMETNYFAPNPTPIWLCAGDSREWNARVFMGESAEKLEHGRVYTIEELEDMGLSWLLKTSRDEKTPKKLTARYGL